MYGGENITVQQIKPTINNCYMNNLTHEMLVDPLKHQ